MRAITQQQFEDWSEGTVTKAFMKAYETMRDLTAREIETISRQVAFTEDAMFEKNIKLSILQEKEDNFSDVLKVDEETINEVLSLGKEKEE